MTVVFPAPVARLSAKRIVQVVNELLCGFAFARRHFGEPDGGFNRFNLAKERTHTAEVVMPPVLEQSCGFWGHAPIVGIGNGPPFVHLGTNAVDDARVVLLLFCGDIAANVQFGLVVFGFALFGLGDGRDEFSLTTRFDNLLGGLPRFIQLPVLTGVVIGRVEEGFFKEEVAHPASMFVMLRKDDGNRN